MTAASPPFRPALRLVYPPGYPGVQTPSSSLEPGRADESLYAPAPVEVAPAPEEHEVRAATRAVTRENRRASGLTPEDARNILAVRIAELLQGGQAAILTPERRARAIRISRLLGVRDFDAHLVIALVQDRARRGELAISAGESPGAPAARAPGVGSAAPLGPSRAPRPPRAPDATTTVMALQFAAAALLAAAMLLGVLAWIS